MKNQQSVAVMLQSIEEHSNATKGVKVSKKRMLKLLSLTVSATHWCMEAQGSQRQKTNGLILLHDILSELKDGKKRNRFTYKDRHKNLDNKRAR